MNAPSSRRAARPAWRRFSALGEMALLAGALALTYWPLFYNALPGFGTGAGTEAGANAAAGESKITEGSGIGEGGGGGALSTGGDMANLFFPMYEWTGRTVRVDGVWPLWNPYTFMGCPAAASALASVFYPVTRLLFWGVGALWIHNLAIFLHLVWAGIGMWHFARSREGLGLRGAGPWLAGYGFAGAAWWWGHLEHLPVVATASWMPWLVWSVGRLAGAMAGRGPSGTKGAGKELSGVALCGLITGLQVLAGHPQEAFISWMGAFAWFLFRCLGMRASGEGGEGGEGGWRARSIRRAWGGCFARLAAALTIGTLLASVQLLLTFELSGHSFRQFDAPEHASGFSMPPALLALLFAPHAFGSYAEGFRYSLSLSEYGIYVGLPELALAALAVLGVLGGMGMMGWMGGVRRMGAKMRRGLGANTPMNGAQWAQIARSPWPWILMALGGLSLALGGNADPREMIKFRELNEFPSPGFSPLGLLLSIFPPAMHFRVPARYLMLWVFGAMALAGLGMRALEALGYFWMRRGRKARGPALHQMRLAAWLVGLLAVLSLAWPARKERFAFRADYSAAQEWLAAGAHPFPEGAPLDNRIYRLTVRDDDLLAEDSASPAAHPNVLFPAGESADLAGELQNRVVLRAQRLAPNFNLLPGRALTDGYEEGLLPIVRYKDFLWTFNRNLRSANPDASLLALMGIRWLWSDLPVESPDWKPQRRRPHEGVLYENRLWRGAAFETSDFPEVDWAALDGPFARQEGPPRPSPSASPHGYILANRPAPPGRPDSSSLTSNSSAIHPAWRSDLVSPNEIIFRRRTPQDPAAAKAKPVALLAAQASYPGWKARDSRGAPLAMRSINAIHSMIEPPPGGAANLGGMIRLSFEPWRFRLGTFFSALAAGLLAAMFAAARALHVPFRRRPNV